MKFDLMIKNNNNTMSLVGGGFHFQPNFWRLVWVDVVVGVLTTLSKKIDWIILVGSSKQIKTQRMVRGAVWRSCHETNLCPNPCRTSVTHGRISSQNWSTSNICKNSVFWGYIPHLRTQGQITHGFYPTKDSSMNDTNTQGVCLWFTLGLFNQTVLVSYVGGISESHGPL